MMETNTQIIANHTAWQDTAKREKIEQIALLLQGALRGEKLVGLKMNVPKEKIEAGDGVIAQLERTDGVTVVSVGLVCRGSDDGDRCDAGFDSEIDQSRRRRDYRVPS